MSFRTALAATYATYQMGRQWCNCTPPTSSIVPSELLILPLNILQTSKWTTFHNQTEQIGRPRTWWWLLYYVLNSAGQLQASRLNHAILVIPLSAPMPSVSLFTIHGLPKRCNITIRGGHPASFWHTHARTHKHSSGESPLQWSQPEMQGTIYDIGTRTVAAKLCGGGFPKLSAGIRTHCANVSLCQNEQWYWWNLYTKTM